MHTQSLLTRTCRRPKALQAAAAAPLVRVPELKVTTEAGGFQWSSPSQKQHCSHHCPEKPAGPHLSRACDLRAVTTSTHTVSAAHSRKSKAEESGGCGGHRLPEPLWELAYLTPNSKPTHKVYKELDEGHQLICDLTYLPAFSFSSLRWGDRT